MRPWNRNEFRGRATTTRITATRWPRRHSGMFGYKARNRELHEDLRICASALVDRTLRANGVRAVTLSPSLLPPSVCLCCLSSVELPDETQGRRHPISSQRKFPSFPPANPGNALRENRAFGARDQDRKRDALLQSSQSPERIKLPGRISLHHTPMKEVAQPHARTLASRSRYPEPYSAGNFPEH